MLWYLWEIFFVVFNPWLLYSILDFVILRGGMPRWEIICLPIHLCLLVFLLCLWFNQSIYLLFFLGLLVRKLRNEYCDSTEWRSGFRSDRSCPVWSTVHGLFWKLIIKPKKFFFAFYSLIFFNIFFHINSNTRCINKWIIEYKFLI